MQSNKGITLITLVIIIIVLVILTSIFVATSMRALDETRSAEITNEINILEQAISDRYASYLKSDGDISLVGSSPTWGDYSECVDAIYETIDFNEMSSDDIIAKKARISNEIQRDYDKYVKIISSGDAMILGIEQFSKQDVFVVDYATARVYGPIE